MDHQNLIKLGVEITCQDINSRGSGFLLRKDGLLATNWHVVHNQTNGTASQNVSVKFPDNSLISAKIVSTEREKDFAILKVDKEFSNVPELANHHDTEPYQKVYFVGRGLDVPTLSLHQGWISAKTQKDGVNVFQIDGPVNQGNSGGGLFNQEGKLIGVVTQTEARFDPDLQSLWQLMPQLTQGGDVQMFGIRLPETLRRIIFYLDRNRHVGIGYAFSIEYIQTALSKL